MHNSCSLPKHVISSFRCIFLIMKYSPFSDTCGRAVRPPLTPQHALLLYEDQFWPAFDAYDAPEVSWYCTSRPGQIFKGKLLRDKGFADANADAGAGAGADTERSFVAKLLWTGRNSHPLATDPFSALVLSLPRRHRASRIKIVRGGYRGVCNVVDENSSVPAVLRDRFVSTVGYVIHARHY